MKEPGLTYAPLPAAAYDIVAERGPGAMAVVWDLYQEAHATKPRWGWLRHTIRKLGERRGLKRDATASLLEALADRGLLVLETVATGARAEGVRIRMLDPTTLTEAPSGRARPKVADARHGPATDPPRKPAPQARQGPVRRHDPATTPPPMIDRPIDRSTDPPQPPAPRGASARRVEAELRAEYIARRLTEALDGLDPPEAESFAKRLESLQGVQVDHLAKLCRPRERLHLGVRVTGRDWPDAPDGIRKGDIREGMRRAAARYRARPPPEPEPPDDVELDLPPPRHHHPQPGAPP